ncbi:MAG TPA: DUF1080 domain-containing protein [bacterium]|nr:DUF1080 domain-containing protein [bacterium]
MRIITFAIMGVFLLSCGQQTSEQAQPNTLTPDEKAEGWQLLFDGESFDGWTGLGRDAVPTQYWTVQGGHLNKMESDKVPTAADGQPLIGGDLMTVNTYENFELQFDWKISPGGNSGVKYNVSEELSTSHDPQYAALGYEYQVLDDAEHPDAEDPTHRAGGLYDLIAPNENKDLNPAGEYNHSRIVFDGTHGEHWLNGEKILEYDINSPEFKQIFAESKYADIEGFREKKNGHIVLQDHIDAVWYRNIKIRVLE